MKSQKSHNFVGREEFFVFYSVSKTDKIPKSPISGGGGSFFV